MLPDPKSAEAIGWLIACLAGTAVSLNQIGGFFDRFRSKPPIAETYATKAELAAVKVDIEGVRTNVAALQVDMRKSEKSILDAGEARAVTLHARINEIEGEIRNLPHQMIALIRNTKEIL
jgi:hypothetical protein